MSEQIVIGKAAISPEKIDIVYCGQVFICRLHNISFAKSINELVKKYKYIPGTLIFIPDEDGE